MTTPEQRIQTFPQRCFNTEEFAYLQTRPEFIEATQHLLTFDDAVRAVELGGAMIRDTFERNDYHTSEFTLRNLNTPNTPPAPVSLAIGSTRNESLAQVDWKTVHTFSVETNTIYLVTETGPKIFSYLSETEAKAAYNHWIAAIRPAERILKSVGAARP